MDQVLTLLANRILDSAHTTLIRNEFPSLLLLIVTKAFPIAADALPERPLTLNVAGHVQRCVALSKLVDASQDIHQ